MNAAPLLWFAGGFVACGIASAIVLQVMRRLQFRQRAYEDAPQTHQSKSGTPTMGGIALVAALALLFVRGGTLAASIFALVALCALIGFVDDYFGIAHKSNAGLRARTKFLLTALVAVAFLREIAGSDALFRRDTIFHAGAAMLTVPHWLWLLLGIIAITGTIHAVNLTDGLDGLAAGTMVPPLVVFAALGAATQVPAVTHAAVVGAGACIAFLAFNRHPAKMFMGDTGSLALGALLAGTAILCGEMLLLIVVGGVFVAEALSVIAQVWYFKATKGKRYLRMSPLHHHFELAGWPETTVTQRFVIASIVCSAIGWAIAR